MEENKKEEKNQNEEKKETAQKEEQTVVDPKQQELDELNDSDIDVRIELVPISNAVGSNICLKIFFITKISLS